MVGDFHKVGFGDLKFFRHQISGRLERFVRLLHAHDLDDLSPVLFKVGGECFKERLAKFVARAPGSAAGLWSSFFKYWHRSVHFFVLIENEIWQAKKAI